MFAQEPLLVLLKGVHPVTLYWWWTFQVNVQNAMPDGGNGITVK
jgi:hypothetical protein